MELGLVALNLIIIAVLLVLSLVTLIGLPGNWLIFLAAAGYGWLRDFNGMSVNFFLLLLGLLLLGELVEFVAGAVGAKRQKASLPTIVAAAIGGVAGGITGTLLMPVVGSLLGAFGGAFLASYGVEYLITGNSSQSAKVAKGVLVAQLAGMVVKTAVAIAMIVAIISHMNW